MHCQPHLGCLGGVKGPSKLVAEHFELVKPDPGDDVLPHHHTRHERLARQHCLLAEINVVVDTFIVNLFSFIFNFVSHYCHL